MACFAIVISGAAALNVPALMGVSVGDAERQLGRRERSQKIKSGEFEGGEFREYSLKGGGRALVRYRDGRVAALTLYLREPNSDPSVALAAAGIAIQSLGAPASAAPFALVWRGELLGFARCEVALRADAERGIWTVVQVKI